MQARNWWDWDLWSGGGGKECVRTELNQLLTSTGGERVADLGWRRSLSLGWDVDFGVRISHGVTANGLYSLIPFQLDRLTIFDRC